ncbi:MAG TPA: glycosyltransferase family 87 protein [Candidatus Limnocylindrales bacterium]
METGTARLAQPRVTLERLRRIDWRWIALALGIVYLALFLTRPMPLYDARAYWIADWADPYAVSGEGEKHAYLYSPAFLQLIAPLRALPFEWFGAAWVVITAVTLILITRHWLFVAMLVPVTLIELEVGNIHFLLAAAVYLGMRYPAVWAFVLLTKVTPGVGLVWFLVRREWRSLAIALGATALIVGVSFVMVPGHWVDWIGSLVGNARQQWPYPLFPVPLAVRLVAAAALIAWGARTDRRWTLIVGTTLAIPTLWPANLAMAVGLPLFVDRMHRR